MLGVWTNLQHAVCSANMSLGNSPWIHTQATKNILQRSGGVNRYTGSKLRCCKVLIKLLEMDQSTKNKH